MTSSSVEDVRAMRIYSGNLILANAGMRLSHSVLPLGLLKNIRGLLEILEIHPVHGTRAVVK